MPHWLMTVFLPCYTAVLGLLMISNIPYPHMAKWLISPTHRVRKLIVLATVAGLSITEYIVLGSGPKITVAVFISCYVLSGPILYAVKALTGRQLKEDDDI